MFLNVFLPVICKKKKPAVFGQKNVGPLGRWYAKNDVIPLIIINQSINFIHHKQVNNKNRTKKIKI